MLEQVLMHLKNWFLVPGGIHEGTYTIEDGGITLPFLANGQYFRICGSVFNDGLHQYPAGDLKTETFDGTVWALAVRKLSLIWRRKSKRGRQKTATHPSARISQRALAATSTPKQRTAHPAAL